MIKTSLVDFVPLQATAVGKLAHRVHQRAVGEGKDPLPSPAELFSLYLELIQLLFSGGCFTDAVTATAYVNSQRGWRVRRIGKEVKRHLQTAYPQYNGRGVDCIVRSTLFECQICTVPQMLGYLGMVRNFQDF